MNTNKFAVKLAHRDVNEIYEYALAKSEEINKQSISTGKSHKRESKRISRYKKTAANNEKIMKKN